MTTNPITEYANARLALEAREHALLSPSAAFADQSLGRPKPEKQCDVRTDYQRDTDRIVHCSSFSRLKQKTQVFLSPRGDHYTTRLTHTLQVSQIARTMARALGLNENLTEAIALGHDVGHTPFGHAGEWAIDEVASKPFRHFEHSVRVLMQLEKNGSGLNLTHEVVDGIRNHTRDDWPSTAEGRLVRLSDRIAYVNHDIEDAVRGGIISESEIPLDISQNLGDKKSARITALVNSVIQNGAAGGFTSIGAGLEPYFDALHTFMFENVYKNPKAKQEESKAKDMIKTMFVYLLAHPEKLPAAADGEPCDTETRVTDYIAGMTDRYAVQVFETLFVPKFWNIL